MKNNKKALYAEGFLTLFCNLKTVYTIINNMEKKRKISIIGSTGSIGTQALEVIEKLQDKFEIIALAGGKNAALLKKQAEKFKPRYTVLG